MNGLYSVVALTALWLGIGGFVMSLVSMVAARSLIFDLTPHGLLGGAVSLLLISVAAWCAGRNQVDHGHPR
jgi:hypothetical protein